MFVRSSLSRLTKSIYFGMSKKKLTQQWRKPIQQLRKQKQQNTPIPPDADQKLKIAKEYVEKQYIKQRGVRMQDDPALKPKQKKMFKKNRQQATTVTQPTGTQTKPTISTPSVNWLQMNQFGDTTELTELVNQALNMFRLKYNPELKEVLQRTRTKFSNDGLEYVLNSLFKQNFLQLYDDFGQLGLQVNKLNPKIITNIIFNLVQQEEFQRVQTLLTQLKKTSTNIDTKHEQFFQVLFFKQTSQQVNFEHGQFSVNISSDNKNLVKKIQIAQLYLSLVQEQGKKKRNIKRTTIVPIWLNKISKIVLKYRFGHQQFKNLLTQIMTHHDYFLPQNFIETEQFSSLLKQFFFGHQQDLKLVLDYFDRHYHKNIKFSTFYRNFTDQLMNYRAQNGQPAFEVNDDLIEFYKKGFQINHKYTSIVCTIIASDAKFNDLAQHYSKNYMQGFPNQTFTSQDTKIVEEGLLNNYNRDTDAEKHQKSLTKITKHGQNLLIKLKASIKLGQYTAAYKLFQDQVFKKVVIERLRKNFEFVLRSQLADKSTSFLKVKEINQFIKDLSDEYLWSLYKRSEDVSVMLKKYIPEDKFSFWEEKQKKERFEDISKKLATGQLDKIKQPQSDIEATGFNLEEYLNTEFPQLRELQFAEYEKQKELIKYTLMVEGLLLQNRLHGNQQIVQKLKQSQDQLSQQNLQILQTFGLKDYNIKQWGWEHFQKRFKNMKMQNYFMKDERVDWSGYSKFIERNRQLNRKNILQEMMIKAPQLFKEAQALVKLNQEPLVNRLLLWGVYTQEPMAVYLAQKLAMQTGQIIPHQLAQKVSKMLSYKRPLSEQFVDKCKQCLRVVGKIDREFIYAFDKEYEHILIRKNFNNYAENRVESYKYDNRDLEDLISYPPRQQVLQKQTKLFRDSIAQRAQLL